MFSPGQARHGYPGAARGRARTAASLGDLLDLGCGYGPIALAMAARSPAATVWAVDVNQRALELCERNAQRAGLPNVRAVTAGEVPAGVVLRRDLVEPAGPDRQGWRCTACSPAGSAGSRPAGAAYLVAQRHLGADSLQRWLAGEGWDAARVTSRTGYRVLRIADPERLRTARRAG